MCVCGVCGVCVVCVVCVCGVCVCVCVCARLCVFRLVFPYMILRCINVLMVIITISICYITAEFILDEDKYCSDFVSERQHAVNLVSVCCFCCS